ncbi:hypothetical protein SAE02_11700 [Skermanella aerolata]|uniref:Uncharacterized protein n=1 Tax=Skermanella aerolata TaxID=393310 RepID=A0A512DKL8_9PROT|nr:hypothetical protein SAE02_11700 [Skermanella aerolata]
MFVELEVEPSLRDDGFIGVQFTIPLVQYRLAISNERRIQDDETRMRKLILAAVDQDSNDER